MEEPELPTLPPEVWSHVLKQLPVKERMGVTTVSKMWNQLVIFTEQRIVCLEVGIAVNVIADYGILFPNCKICVIGTYSQLVGLVKRHPQMTHLKIINVAFENIEVTQGEIERLTNEIAYREHTGVPIISFEIEKRNATQPVHYNWISLLRHLQEFVWHDIEFDPMAGYVNNVIQANSLQHLAVNSYGQALQININSQLQTFIFESDENIDRQQIWNTLVANCTQSLTSFGALLHFHDEMEYVNHFQNLTDLRFHLISDEIEYRFAFNAERLRALTLYYQEDPAPFAAVRHLFKGKSNGNLEILDLNLPLTTPYNIHDICSSSRNLRLLKLPISYRMGDACVTAIKGLRNLEQLSLEFPNDDDDGPVNLDMEERLLVAILNSPLLPNLRVISVPRPTFREPSYNALLARAQLMPNAMFFFLFSRYFNFPQTVQLKQIGRDVPLYFFEFRDLIEYDYFAWQRVTPEYFQ
ncbi:hypothetical protein B4U80_11759 [Leptotrombidium deliense]|uniref:F-box domain-containing protein n=1 Tax=Leptotrombidium deliense TaxID=299467 RepID=A0A443S2Y1_9ACAR|nr:hypothetical protein B4U80_11759 [Leptotrombidium deliense]